MATWKDGAAYAPIERPDGFATPEAEPLHAAPPRRAETPGPIPAPQGYQPLPQAVPLGAVGTKPQTTRNPAQPFAVTSALVTSFEHAAGERDPRIPFASSAPTTPEDLPPPSGAPLALADQPPPPQGQPGYHYPPNSPLLRARDNERKQIQNLALGIFAVGMIAWAAAAILLIAGGGLLQRVPHLKKIGWGAIGTGADRKSVV